MRRAWRYPAFGEDGNRFAKEHIVCHAYIRVTVVFGTTVGYTEHATAPTAAYGHLVTGCPFDVLAGGGIEAQKAIASVGDSEKRG